MQAFFKLAKHTLRKRDEPISEDRLALQLPLSREIFPRFRFFSLGAWCGCYHAAPHSSSHIDRTRPRTPTFLHRSFLFSRRRGRAKGNFRVRVVNHAVRINSLDVPAVRRFKLRRQTPRNSAFGSIGRRLSPGARFSSLLPSRSSGKARNSELGWKKV